MACWPLRCLTSLRRRQVDSANPGTTRANDKGRQAGPVCSPRPLLPACVTKCPACDRLRGSVGGAVGVFPAFLGRGLPQLGNC